MSQATWEPAENLPAWSVALYENRHPKSGATPADFQEGTADPDSSTGVSPPKKAKRQQKAPGDWDGLNLGRPVVGVPQGRSPKRLRGGKTGP